MNSEGNKPLGMEWVYSAWSATRIMTDRAFNLNSFGCLVIHGKDVWTGGGGESMSEAA